MSEGDLVASGAVAALIGDVVDHDLDASMFAEPVVGVGIPAGRAVLPIGDGPAGVQVDQRLSDLVAAVRGRQIQCAQATEPTIIDHDLDQPSAHASGRGRAVATLADLSKSSIVQDSARPAAGPAGGELVVPQLGRMSTDGDASELGTLRSEGSQDRDLLVGQ